MTHSTRSLFLPAIVLMAAASCAPKAESTGDRSVAVKVATATLSTEKTVPQFAFISKPYRQADLSFRVSGPLEKFEVFSGNAYRAGQTIASIDNRDFVIRHDRAEAVYNQAKAEAERVEALYLKENISASANEKARAEHLTSKTAYQTALNEMNDTRLVAPFDGYVAEVYVEQFQEVRASQPVLSMVDVSRLKVEAYVPQNVAYEAEKGSSVKLVFDAMPGREFRATIEDISKSTTQNNLSYLLTAILPNADNALLGGMSGKLFFETSNPTAAAKEVLMVPQSAVCHRPSVGSYVWVVDSVSGTVRRQVITTGAMRANMVVVCAGLESGSQVATSSLRFLTDGSSIKIAQ